MLGILSRDSQVILQISHIITAVGFLRASHIMTVADKLNISHDLMATTNHLC